MTVARAQTFTTSVPVGSSPAALAVNPVTNKTYIADGGGSSVTVINGISNTVSVTVSVGTNPAAIAVNPVTNTIYVANSGGNSVTVINGATDTVVTTVGAGTAPAAIAVNPVTNTIYVGNSGSNNVTVINGSSNQVAATVGVGTNPVAVALNTTTNTVYVANKGSANVTAISGSSNQVAATVGVGTSPVSLAVNPATNQIYVANSGSNNVTVINGATNAPTSVADPNANGPIAVALNAVTNTIYVANRGSNNVTAIAGATNVTTTVADPNASGPAAVAVNPVTNEIYVVNNGSNNVTAFAGATNSTTTIRDPNASLPAAVAVNPVTNQIYAANSGNSTVSVINGATNNTATVTDSSANHPAAVAVNPVTNLIYVANSNSNKVSVILGVSNITETVTDSNANHPVALAVNPFTNKIYVANANSHNVTVIDGTNNSTTTVTDPNANGPIAVALNPVTNKIYVPNSTSNNVTVIDGTTNSVSTMADPNALGPVAVAVNPATGKVYVANNGSSNVSVFDPVDSTVQNVADPAGGHPIAIVVDATTNRVYVANSSSDNLTVIDGTTNTVVATIDADISPIAVDVNSTTNTIYVANSGTGNVTVINGATLAVAATVSVGTAPHAIVVNPTTNQIYVANSGNGNSDPGSITAIDGASNTSTRFADPNAIGPYALAANFVTNQVYVANNLSANVTAVTEQSVQPNAIQSTISPFTGNPNNQTVSETPNISFSVSNTLTGGAIDGAVYQMDSWIGPWTAATSTASPGGFTGTTATLLPGFHILYVYASDGEEGTSTITGSQSSPLIGTIAAYGFLVAPAVADISPANLNFGNQQTGTPSSSQIVTLGNTGGTTLNFSYTFTGNNAADFSEGSGDTCSTAGGQLAPSTSCTVSIIFTPSTTGAELAALTVTDNSNGVADSTQSASLAGTGSAVPTFTLAIGEAGSGLGSVSSNPSGIACQPTCSASFKQGTTVTLTATPSAGSAFLGWTGACTGTGACIVTMNSAQTVTANFSLTSSTACNATGAAIWKGGASGNWNNSSNWSTGSVPNSATAIVCINDGNSPASAVTLDISATVETLVIDPGSSLSINNALDFDVTGSISNAGQITVNAGGNGTALSFTGNVMLTGGGTVVLTNAGNAWVREDGTGSLTNVNNTISGQGIIGTTGLTFTNQAGGVVNATTGALAVNATGTVTNQGLFEATGSGNLQVYVTVNNAGGMISAGAGATVQFYNGTRIEGGTLTSGAGATFGTVQSTVVLDGATQGPLTNAAAYTINNATDTQLKGTINNTGSITVNAGGNGTAVSMVGAVTLTGGGTVVLTNAGNAWVREDINNSTLTNVNNMISGQGIIGTTGLTFTNQAGGVVNANSPGNALAINATGAVTNQGLFEATGGGVLQVYVTVNNANAKIVSTGSSGSTNSAVQFYNGTRIEGGTLTSGAGATFGTVQSTVVLDGATQGPLTNAAAYTINNATDTQLEGTINNTGSITVNAGGNGTAVSMVGAVTLTGGGTVVLTNAGNAWVREDGTGSLTNVNNTISGQGIIGTTGLTFTNQAGGVVNATTGALAVNATGTVTNQGLFEATGSGNLQVYVTVNNAGGMISAGAGATVQFYNGTRIEGGTLTSGAGATFGTVQSTVVLDGATQGPLTNAAAYTINNATDTQLKGTINNTGSITVNAGGNGTAVSMVGAVTLTGGGTVVLTNAGNAWVREDINNSTLTNVNNMISGQGIIGTTGLTFTNQAGGVVNANSPGNALAINATGAVTNQGLFEATGGGVLQVYVTVNNANAKIVSTGSSGSTNSAVQFYNGTRIEGGTLTSGAGATFGTVQSTVVLDGATQGPLTNAAAYTINNATDTQLEGTINNTGSITVNAGGNGTAVSMVGAVTLTGGGTVVLTNAGNAWVREDGTGSLTNVNNTISGQGIIGTTGLTFTNQAGGVVNATTGALAVNATGTVTNQGLFEATGSGNLQVYVTVNNAGGMISAGAGATVQFYNGTRIEGGTLTSGAGATFGTVQSTVVLDGATQGPLTNAAAYTINNATDTQLKGTINNTGSITVNAGGNGTAVSMVGAVTLTGGGTVTMTNGNAAIRQDVSGSSLTNSGNTITGPGEFTIPTFTETSGFIQIPSGVSDSVTTFAISGGNAQVDGSVSVSNGVSTSNTGTISGTGSISNNVANSGVTEAGDIPAAGTLSISSLTQSASGAYEVAIGGATAGTQYSQLHVSGAAILAGALNIRFIGGFTPTSGNQFTILTAGSVSGQFSTINSPSLPTGLGWTVSYNATSVVLNVVTSSSNSFTLTISEPGTGSGSVTDNLGQINCIDTSGVVMGSCSASYLSGTIVTLTANPSTGTTFNGWSTCTGTGPCSVTLNSNQAEQATFGPVVPTFTLSVSDLGTGTGSVTDNTGQINCSEANGRVTGTCSASYTSGTPVTLTASATSPSTFAGWGSACSSFGTGTSCSVTMNSNLSATANFIPPPSSVNLTFNPGTTVTQQAVFDCPSNPNPTPSNPCLDPNAHALQLTIPQVGTGFTVTATATEIPPTQANGLCEVGNTVLNDFDCRFVTFFSYGTDNNGNTIVPLCYPYANGNCVHYAVYSGTPGTEPNPSFYTGPVGWKITWNDDTFVPPAPYTGSQPRLYDDPDYAPTPTSAVGTICTQPMTINGVPQSYSCQFEFDITTFFNPTEPVDSGIGGRTQQLNDVVVAFPPNTAGQLTVSSTPDASTTNAGSPIGFTITVSNAGPGTENNVVLNDPLPSGAEVNWSISPVYGGPGTCAITGSVGSQVLNCSFGSLASGNSATLHLSSTSAGAGTYTNVATISASNTQLLTIATVTVQALASAFSGLTSSQTISFGTASINLSGIISASGPVYPTSGETISVTINGTIQNATIVSNGAFSLTFPTATIPASVTPYTITYSYPGDSNLTPATDSSTTLTVNAIASTFTLSVSDLGTGTGSVTDNTGQINCSEANGRVTGTCSASYTSGTPVTLTASATSPSTFAGWGSACSSFGTGTSCSVTMNSNLSATANFIPPPASVNLTFNPGTTVTQQAVFDCPSNPNPTPSNPCLDPNAHALQLTIPQVGTGFTVTATATEIPPTQANGLCEVGNTVLNDFDCRFVTFFSYGTDNNGNTIVPLCYPYANGNCVHYAVYSGTPGTEPNPSFYTGPVGWKITWNDDTFVPPAPYTGSQPRLYDDPDYAPTPTSAVGTICTQPMTINGVPQSYSCQFEFDITTFFNPTEPVDSGIGGRTQQLNDVVVAFPPNTAGQLTVSSTPDASTTNAGSPIGFTITVSNAGPGTENNVVLNDPLPSGAEVNWSISPAYSGPGTCAITGSVGSQVLNCSFGSLASGNSATLHLSSASAGAGTYNNAATVTVNNQQLLLIASVTVQALGSAFSGLTPSQTISFGTASINLSGVISASGPVYPTSGETISVTINGTTQNAKIVSNGAFSLTFPTATIPASTSPYTITYSYPGDSNLTPATDTSTTLTVSKANQSVTLTGAPATAVYNSTFSVSATASSGLPVTITPSGACTITGNTVTMTSGTGICSLAANQAGNSNYNAAPQVTSSTTAQTAGSTTTITSNTPNPSSIGQAVTITVKVTGNGTPTGSVHVNASTTESCATTLNSGTGSCSITFTTAGTRALTATYSGDSDFNGSTSSNVSQTVNNAATLKISPTSLNFGNVYVGRITVRTITLTNTGTISFAISNVSINSVTGGDSDDFFELSLLCPRTLAPGKSCSIIVSFIPDADQSAQQSALLIITDTAAGSPQTVPLTATAINPQATLSMPSLNFGTQKVNSTSAAKSVTLTNTGTTPLNLTNIAVSGNFALSSGTTCVSGGTVNPSARCILNVTFTPKSKGSLSGAVTITDNALTSPQAIILSGTGN